MNDRATQPPADDARPHTATIRVTSELELIIAGALLFGLLTVPGRIDAWYASVRPHVAGDLHMAYFLGYYYLMLIAYTLIATFCVHIGARAYWVGLMGLQSVYPEGPDWARVRNRGPIGDPHAAREAAELERASAVADDFCSLDLLLRVPHRALSDRFDDLGFRDRRPHGAGQEDPPSRRRCLRARLRLLRDPLHPDVDRGAGRLEAERAPRPTPEARRLRRLDAASQLLRLAGPGRVSSADDLREPVPPQDVLPAPRHHRRRRPRPVPAPRVRRRADGARSRELSAVPGATHRAVGRLSVLRKSPAGGARLPVASPSSSPTSSPTPTCGCSSRTSRSATTISSPRSAPTRGRSRTRVSVPAATPRRRRTCGSPSSCLASMHEVCGQRRVTAGVAVPLLRGSRDGGSRHPDAPIDRGAAARRERDPRHSPASEDRRRARSARRSEGST